MEIPWVDGQGNLLETVEERLGVEDMGHTGPRLIPDLGERIMKGEYELPFYADLPAMPEHERRAIFGLMVGHEGKTRVPVYEVLAQAGFDPDRDMLQANVLPPMLAGQWVPWWDPKSKLATPPNGGIPLSWEVGVWWTGT